MDKTGKGASQGRTPYRRSTSLLTTAWQNAEASAQRQAWWAVGAITLVCAAAWLGGAAAVRAEDVSPPAIARSPQAVAAAQAMQDARERRLRDEQRAIEGRVQALDRRLDLREAGRSPAPLSQPDGLPAPLQDPVAGRWEIERRGLVDRDQVLEQRLRNEQFDQQRRSRMRSW